MSTEFETFMSERYSKSATATLPQDNPDSEQPTSDLSAESWLSQEEMAEFEKQFTRHTFAEHPVTKLVLVGGVTLVAVFFIALAYIAFSSSFKGTKRAQPIDNKSNVLPEADSTKTERELDSARAKLATKGETEGRSPRPSPPSANRRSASSKPTSTRTVSPPPPPPPRTAYRPTEPRTVYRRPIPQTAARPIPMITTPPRPSIASMTKPSVPQVNPIAELERLRELSVIEPEAVSTGDRTQQPIQEAPLDSQNAIVEVAAHPTEPPSSDRVEQYHPHQMPISPYTPANYTPVATDSSYLEDRQNSPSNESAPHLARINPQHVPGRTLNPVVSVSDYRTREEDISRVAVEIEEPILDERGKEVVPAGAQVLAQARFSGGTVSLTPISLSFEDARGTYREIPFSPQSASLSGREGILVASLESEGGDGISMRDAAQALTAVAGIAGFDGGAEASTVLSLLQNRSRSRESRVRFWLLEEGQKVQLNISRPVTIPASSPQEEYDFDYESEEVDETEE